MGMLGRMGREGCGEFRLRGLGTDEMGRWVGGRWTLRSLTHDYYSD